MVAQSTKERYKRNNFPFLFSAKAFCWNGIKIAKRGKWSRPKRVSNYSQSLFTLSEVRWPRRQKENLMHMSFMSGAIFRQTIECFKWGQRYRERNSAHLSWWYWGLGNMGPGQWHRYFTVLSLRSFYFQRNLYSSFISVSWST